MQLVVVVVAKYFGVYQSKCYYDMLHKSKRFSIITVHCMLFFVENFCCMQN